MSFSHYYHLARKNPLPLWVGIGVIGAVELRRRWKQESEEPGSVRLYKALPLRTLSKGWGKVNDFELPQWSRPFLLGAYVRAFGCNMGEAEEEDLKQYRNLGELFRRRLKPCARPVCDKAKIVSPCDGKLLYSGRVDGNSFQAIKGVNYSLSDFLGPSPDAPLQDLHCCILYLAPGDYHRFHAPVDLSLSRRLHFDGLLLSVSPSAVKRVPNLFSVNERVVYHGSWEEGFFSMTAVGATNVGSIKIGFDRDLLTNIKKKDMSPEPKELVFPSQVKMSRGDYFGEFNLGSTIVLIFQSKGDVNFEVKHGEVVKMGQALVSAD